MDVVGGGSGSPRDGPDSTCGEESKIDEKIASMETKILAALDRNHKLIQEQDNKIQKLQTVVDTR